MQSNTEVQITASADGELSTNRMEIAIVAGETVSFRAPAETGIALCLSSRSSQALSRPGTTRVDLEPGGKTLFEFSSVRPGVYWVVIQTSDSACSAEVPDEDGGDAPVLQIAVDPGGAESGPGDTIRPKGT